MTTKLNRCYFQATQNGTPDFTLSTAVSGFLDPAGAGAANGMFFAYIAENSTQWELGIGLYTSANTTLSRSTIVSSSASNTKVSFSLAPKVRMGVVLAADYSYSYPSVTVAGAIDFPPLWGAIMVRPKGYIANEKIYTASGAWVEEFDFNAQPSVTSFSFDDLGAVDGSVVLSTGWDSLTSVTFPELEVCSTSIAIVSCTTLTSFSFPKLRYSGAVDIESFDYSAQPISFPNLEIIKNTLTISTMQSSNVDFQKLELVGEVGIDTCSNLGGIDLGALKVATTLALSDLASLTVLDLSSLETVSGSINFTDLAALTTLSFPALTSFSGNFTATGAALDQTSVDSILATLVSISSWGTGGQTVDLSGGTSSTPSAGGLTSKATLEGRGATVTVN